MKKTFTLNNGVKIPQIGFGTWQLEEGAETTNAVHTALISGYDHIDTALVYDNEKSVSQGLKASGRKREEIFITSKMFNDVLTYDEAITAIETSLKNLEVDYIDLYLIHWPNPIPVRDSWEKRNAELYRALEDMYQAGKLKAIGVSNFWVHHLEALKKTWRVKPQVNQIFITPGTVQQDVIDYCFENNILIEAYSPLGRGHVLESPLMQELSLKYQKSPAQLAINWCLAEGYLPLVRSVTKSRIIENLEVDDFKIAAEDLEKIRNLPGSLEYLSPDERNY